MTNQLILTDDPSLLERPDRVSELTLGAFVAMLWRRRWMILGIVLLSVVIGSVRLMLATPSYVAQARIYIQQSGPRLVGEHREQLALAPSNDFLAAQADIVTSTSVLKQASETVKTLGSIKGEADVVKHLRTRVSARLDKDTQLLTVLYQGTHPDDAAATVNAVVQAYIGFELTERRAAAARTIETLESDRQERSTELAARTAELVALQQEYGALSLSDGYATVVTSHLSKLSEALIEARLEAGEAKTVYEDAVRALGVDAAALARFEAGSGSESFSGAFSKEASSARSRMIAILQTQLREARRLSGPNHPQVQAYRSQLEQLVLSHVASLKQAMLAAEAKVTYVENRLNEQQQAANRVTSLAVEFTRLRSETDRLQKLIDAISDRINEIQLASGVPMEMVQIIDPARPPTTPASPRAVQVLGMSVGIGLVLGMALSFVGELRRPRVRSMEHLQSLIEAPVLGMIPHVDSSEPATRYYASSLDPSGLCAEAYRILRTSLVSRRREECRTVVVTSGQPGEGKSTVACNLAIVLAQAGQRVVLVDADLRNSYQQVTLGHGDTPGLSDVLTGTATLQSTIVASRKHSPDVLPPGRPTQTPAELLNSKAFKELLSQLREMYDFVVVDTPPVGHVADARIAAVQCDTTILVIRAEYSNPRLCDAAYQSLRAVGADVVGLVINDVPPGRFNGYGVQAAYPYGGRGGADTETPALVFKQ